MVTYDAVAVSYAKMRSDVSEIGKKSIQVEISRRPKYMVYSMIIRKAKNIREYVNTF